MDVYTENIRVVSLITGHKLEGFVKWRGLKSGGQVHVVTCGWLVHFTLIHFSQHAYLNLSGCSIKVDNEMKTLRVILMSIVADAPARCLLADMAQYNGQFGCPCCKAPGETFKTSDRGHSRIYPYNVDNRLSGLFEHRNSADHLETAKTVEAAFKASRRAHTQALQGVKGLSPLAVLPQFDIIRGTTVDYMHCALLGVMKMLLTLWFDVSHRSEPWSLRRNIQQISGHLSFLKPPNFVHRLPPSIDDLGLWKASEFRSFLLFFRYHCCMNICLHNTSSITYSCPRQCICCFKVLYPVDVWEKLENCCVHSVYRSKACMVHVDKRLMCIPCCICVTRLKTLAPCGHIRASFMKI